MMKLIVLLAALAAAAPAGVGSSDVTDANRAARVGPRDGAWVNAIATYPWSDGALYQLFTAPGRVSDIALQPGERLAGPGPVAAGDTVRWIIGDTESGTGAARQVHVLVKPTLPGIATNLVITTDRRTYHLELRSTAEAYMASVSWRYPQPAPFAAPVATQPQPVPKADGIALFDLAHLNFRYRIEGEAPWKPLRVFDDGRRVAIDFPPDGPGADLPPLFLVDPRGGPPQVLNYRVAGHRMIVDRLFSAAELRLGAEGRQARVRLVREP